MDEIKRNKHFLSVRKTDYSDVGEAIKRTCMKKIICYLIVSMVFLLVGCASKEERRNKHPDPNEIIKNQILDDYPDEMSKLLYNGKDGILIIIYDGEISVTARVKDGGFTIPVVIDVLCPVVLDVIEKNDCTLDKITVQYYEGDTAKEMISSTIVNWDSDNGKTGTFFVASTGEYILDCTSEDISEYYDSLGLSEDFSVEENQTIEESQTVTQTSYWINTETKKFHRENCSYIQGGQTTTESRSILIAKGYSPCKHCNP